MKFRSIVAMTVQAIRRGVIALLYIFALLAIWDFCVMSFSIPSYILPRPQTVLASLIEYPGYFLLHLGITFMEAFFGALLGFLFGLSVGLLLRYAGTLGRVLEPPVIASQVFPKEALAPIFLIVFGFGIEPKIVISALICFFPVAVSVERGLRETPELAERLMIVLGANRFQRFWRCQLPYAAPFIFASLRLCTTLSVIGAIVGEFVGSNGGLGYVVRAANGEIAMDRVYAALILLGLLGAAFYGSAILIEKVFFGRLTRPLRNA